MIGSFFSTRALAIYEKLKPQMGNLQVHAKISFKNLHN